jgi:hypothetical protein
MNKFSKPIHELVKRDLDKRAKLGLKKYGQYLYAKHSRNALQDLYEELLDAASYCKQILMEEEMELKIKRIRESRVPKKKKETEFPF